MRENDTKTNETGKVGKIPQTARSDQAPVVVKIIDRLFEVVVGLSSTI